MKLPKTIQTQNLILRPWRFRDIKALYFYCKEEEFSRLAGFSALGSYTDAFARMVLYYRRGSGYAVELRQTGQLIGSVSFMDRTESHIDLSRGEREVGYWIGRPYWGNGYGPEALEAGLEAAFSFGHLSRVWSVVQVDNHQSCRVQEKLGFFRAGIQNIPAVTKSGSLQVQLFEMPSLQWEIHMRSCYERPAMQTSSHFLHHEWREA